MDKIEKTNVMRILDIHKIEYKMYKFCETTESLTGLEAANKLGLDPNRVFKTLVTQGKSGKYYVFDIPVDQELDLKKAAYSVNEKNVSMIKSKDLLPLTGYIHGGCSPIGMKKALVTTFHNSASNFEYIVFSGGKVGYFVEIAFKDLNKVINYQQSDLIVDFKGEKTY